MHPLVEKNRSELERLCERYHVRRFELFGSAATQAFDQDSSDLDFLVEFEDLEPVPYADAYFGLLEDLSSLFQRPVDLVVLSAIKNPYFLRGIEQSRTLLYAA